MMIRSSCVLCWLSPLLQGIISKQAKQRLDRRDSEQVLCVYRSASTRVCGSTVLCGAAVLPLRTTYEPNNTKKTCHGTYSVSTLKERERKREDNKLKMKQDTTMLSMAHDESRESKVAVCWYDQLSSWWTNRRTTHKDQTRAPKEKQRVNTKKGQCHVQLVGEGRPKKARQRRQKRKRLRRERGQKVRAKNST